MCNNFLQNCYDKESYLDVAILVVSCDSYCDLWQPFFQCFFKYWPDCSLPVYLGSNHKTYNDIRVKPIMVGRDLDYSSNLLSMLSHINQKWVIVWVEDRVLSAPVDSTRINNMLDHAITRDLGFLKLIASHPYAFVNYPQEIGEITKGTRYRASMTVGMWKKTTLLKLLLPGESAWAFERSGSRRSVSFEEKFFSLSYRMRKNPPLTDTHLIIKGRLLREARSFLIREGLSSITLERPLQSFGSYLYVKFYVAVKNMAASLKCMYVK